MQDRYQDRKLYFQEQRLTTGKFVLPYIEDFVELGSESRVLEIGCGEGGNLMPFLEKGCEGVGVDLNEKQIERAKVFVEEELPSASALFIYRDIYEVSPKEIGQFDLIYMRDVIEHIHDQERFMTFLPVFLKPGGKIFFGFPPWRMPFGGHQQICSSKYLSKLPFFHLLPTTLYRGVLRLFGERENTIEALLEIKETGISIRRFERIVKNAGYQSEKKTLFFINPNYETKFGLNPRKLNAIMAAIPHLRDFFTTCYYCLISKKPSSTISAVSLKNENEPA